MSINFVCPLGHKLSVPDDRAGQQGECPVCHQRLFIPGRSLDAAEDANEAAVENKAAEGASVLAAVTFDVSGSKSHAAGTASPQPETAAPRPMQPPPNPWRNELAPIASPPPLPQLSSSKSADTATLPSSPASVHWVAWRRADALEGYAVARPDPRQLEIAYWLASLLPFAAAFCAAPALPHMQFAGAPGWAQLMLCTAVLHIGYAAWLALLPDVSTVRVGMYLFATSATAYLAAMTAICFFSNSQLTALGLSGMRGPAAAWCGLAFVVVTLTAGACAWIARQWQDARA